MSENLPPVPPVLTADGPPRSAGLGIVALIVAIAAIIISTLLSAVTGFAATSGAMHHAVGISPEGLENLSNEQLLALLTPVRGLVLWTEIGFWLGTALGVWALIQGIVPIATARGRGAGIAATIVAATAPIFWWVAVIVAALAGVLAGAS